MDKPKTVINATNLIWLSIALSALAAVVDKRSGLMTNGDFSFNLVLYALLCIVPYKLANRSNPTRYVYGVLCALSVLSLLAGQVATLPKYSHLSALAQLPLMALSCFWLFTPPASDWFERKESETRKQNRGEPTIGNLDNSPD